MFPQQAAMWTKGASFPTHKPEPTERTNPTDLITSVWNPNIFLITNPPAITLISGIALPAASGEWTFTISELKNARII